MMIKQVIHSVSQNVPNFASRL